MYEQKSIPEIEEILSTSAVNGLSSEEALKRLNADGKNTLVEKKKPGLFIKFLMQFNDPMIYILIIAGIISFILGEFADGAIILAVILLNAVIGTIQESKAEKALEALKEMSSPKALVKRDGAIIEIKAEDVVVGDLLILDEGSIIAADVRLTNAYNLKTDEASLTGESLPVEKDHRMTFEQEVTLGDRINLAYMSTAISTGHGEGIVVATGMNTEIGKIATMLDETDQDMTPLQKRLADLGKMLGILAVVICVFLFIVALIQGREVGEMFITSISLAVAAVPEGLPAVVTIVLAMGVQKMAKSNAIVRRLPAVETLGAVSTVLSDKTGTLTQNKMTVIEGYFNGELKKAEEFNKDTDQMFIHGFMLCTNASIKGDRIGDPTEIALLEWGKKYDLLKEDLETTFPRKDELPFDSDRKMMTTMHDYNGKKISFTKGAIDLILVKTTKILDKGNIRAITQKDIENIKKATSEMSSNALRVLALTCREGNSIEEENLVLVGLVGMIDPPREEAAAAVAKFKQAGIRTVMITGDHIETAFAIARHLGIAEKPEQCINGEKLNSLSDDELKELALTATVFARVTPEHKVRIVKAFKANNQIVSMTGDGVNDAPSLKAADIGIAMGITGTDVAKSAADMILSDDNFASIEKAVEEGRGIYANIKKTVLFLLSSNFAEVMTMLICICIGLPMPLIAIHILWVNLITDSLPAIALGADKKDKGIMDEKPRKANESLFAHGGLKFTIFYGAVLTLITLVAFMIEPVGELVKQGQNVFDLKAIITLLENDELLRIKSQTFAFTTLGMAQLFHMLGMSDVKQSFIHVFKKKNTMMLIAFIVGFVLQIAVTEVHFLSEIFKTAELSLVEWLWLALLSAFPLITHELLAPILRGKKKKKVA